MIESQAARLRELTENHYHGLIDWEAYRAERARLLDNLTFSDDEADDDTDESTLRDPGRAGSGIHPAGRARAWALPWWPWAVAGIVIAGVAGWLLLPPAANDAAPHAAAITAVPVSATGLIEGFLDRETWDQQAVAGFLLEWQALPDVERTEVRSSETFRRLVAGIRRRIMVDRAVGAPVSRDGLTYTEALSVELDLGMVAARPGSAHSSPLPDEPTPDTQAPADSEPAAVPAASPAGPVAGTPHTAESTRADAPSSHVASEQPCSADRLNYRSATCWDMVSEQVRAPLLRVLPAGRFRFGDPEDPSASPVTEQVIPRPFAIGLTEVSYGEYIGFCRAAGHRCPEPRWASDDHPIVDVTWQDAQAYLAWLSEQTGARYRLPTEVEWEYAARGGKTRRYPFGDEIDPVFARYDSGRGNGGALPVTDQTTRRNPYRLIHMAGNVRELTADVWRESYGAPPISGRVAVRGGSYADPPERLRNAAREGIDRSHADARTGFRVVRELR